MSVKISRFTQSLFQNVILCAILSAIILHHQIDCSSSGREFIFENFLRGYVADVDEHVSNDNYRHDFTYDRTSWEKTGPPRIALLFSTHKTATTTMQKFFYRFTGTTVTAQPDAILDTGEQNRKPHPSINDWVWPHGANSEIPWSRHAGGGKSFAGVAEFVLDREPYHVFKNYTNTEYKESRGEIADYIRTLFRKPWMDGKKLIISSEWFDAMVENLRDDSVTSDQGEETHVSPDASAILDNLLDLLPWDDKKENANSVAPLRLEDIEVHIHYRTPRIDHLASLWKQVAFDKRVGPHPLRQFLQERQNSFFQINSLAMALQFARRGIKTTIVDMQSVLEAGENLQDVAACDVLHIGEGKLCDADGRLHIPNVTLEYKKANERQDTADRGLTDEQLEDIDRALNRYDCGVWQHLQKYQQKGILRVLYPSKDLFAICSPEGSRDISWRETVQTITAIASVEAHRSVSKETQTAI